MNGWDQWQLHRRAALAEGLCPLCTRPLQPGPVCTGPHHDSAGVSYVILWHPHRAPSAVWAEWIPLP